MKAGDLVKALQAVEPDAPVMIHVPLSTCRKHVAKMDESGGNNNLMLTVLTDVNIIYEKTGYKMVSVFVKSVYF